MAHIFTNAEINSLEDSFPMGDIWVAATDEDQVSAVELAEGMWESLSWAVNPFGGSQPEMDEASSLEAILALHARHLLELGGSPTFSFPDVVVSLLRSHLSEPIDVAGAASSTVGSQLERGAQNRLTLAEQFRLRREFIQEARKLAPLFSATLAGTTGVIPLGEGGLTQQEVGVLIDLMVESWALEGNNDAIPADKLTNAPGGGGGGLSLDQVDSRVRTGVENWAEVGNNDAIPADKLTNAPPSGLSVSEVDARVRSGVDNWAETGNSDAIPADKLTNAPAPGLTQSQVDARVASGVADWAEDADATPIPADKLTNAPRRTDPEIDARARSVVEDWAEAGNNDAIPADKLANAPAAGLSQSQVDARVASGVADWAEDADATPIPAAKLTNAPAPGLSQSQVDGRVTSGVADWAEAGNSDAIPADKLTNASGGGSGTIRTGRIARYQRVLGTITVDQLGTDSGFSAGAANTFQANLDSPTAAPGGWLGVWAVLLDSSDESVVDEVFLPWGAFLTGQAGTEGLWNLNRFQSVSGSVQFDNDGIELNASGNAYIDVYGALAGSGGGGGGGDSTGGLTQSQVDARVRAGVADWAEDADATPIPADKLTNAPAPGLSQSQVDARVRSGVDNWAETGNSDAIPADKLANAPRRTDPEIDARVRSGVEDWAEAGSMESIPAIKLVNAPSGLSQSQVDGRVAHGVENWAETGNSDAIPADKLTNAPSGGGGLTQSQVDDRIEHEVNPWALIGNDDGIPQGKLGFAPMRTDSEIDARVADWAETGNSDAIPADKLANAPAAGLSQSQVEALIAAHASDDDAHHTPGTGTTAEDASGWTEGDYWYESGDITDGALSLSATVQDGAPDGFVVSGTEIRYPRNPPSGVAGLVITLWSGGVRINTAIRDWGGSFDTQKLFGNGSESLDFNPNEGQQSYWRIDVSRNGSFSNAVRFRIHPLYARGAAAAGGGGGSDLSLSEVDARIADWAETGNNNSIPSDKLANAPKRTDSEIDARVADWAETGNSDAIPADKLTNAPAGGGGVTLSQVDARVASGVADWAETGNSDAIPADKLGGYVFRVLTLIQYNALTPDGNTIYFITG